MSAYPENPFTPGFGEVPLHFAGREGILRELRRAYESERRRPELTLAIQGARGTGKTALLTIAAEEAAARGWIAVNVMATEGMLEDILIQAGREAAHLLEPERGPRISSIGLGDVFQIGIEPPSESIGNWRSKMSDLLDALAEQNAGLLITVDEVQPSLQEVVQLASTYQLFVRENRKVALMLAGLPHNMSALLQDKSVSFLRRAQACHLGKISNIDIELAMRKTIEQEGRDISGEALMLAVEASDGFPFMMQLVGYRIWEESPTNRFISLEDVQAGIDIARREMKSRVISATYHGLSDGDKRFLEAMLPDDDESKIGEIAARLGRTTAYATQYKLRLIEQGIIGERGRGKIAFDLPYMREYVQERCCPSEP